MQHDEGVARREEEAALRELRAGPLRYAGETVELTDRLLFVSAARQCSPQGALEGLAAPPALLTGPPHPRAPTAPCRGPRTPYAPLHSTHKQSGCDGDWRRGGPLGKVSVDIDTEEIRALVGSVV